MNTANLLKRWSGEIKSNDGDTVFPVEYGQLEVPLRRDIPSDRTISVGFVRMRSNASEPQPPVFYLPGGPGGAGSRAIPREKRLFEALLEVGDVIALDPRGVGTSQPIVEDRAGMEPLPLQTGVTRDVFLEVCKRNSKRVAEYWLQRDLPLAGYNVIEVADDVAAIADALGLDTFSIYGASFGSHTALTILRKHGDRIHRAVLGTVEGFDDTYKLPSNVSIFFNLLSKKIAEANWMSGTYPGLEEMMSIVHERLDANPVRLEIGNGSGDILLTKFIAQRMVAGALGDTNIISKLPALYAMMFKEEYAIMSIALSNYDPIEASHGMALAMDSASGATQGRRARIERERKDCLLDDAYNLPFPYVSDEIGCIDLGDEFRSPMQSTIPTLFFSALLDGRTPRSNATDIMSGFSNSQELLIENDSHILNANSGIYEECAEFLRSGSVRNDRLSLPFEFMPGPVR